jgi:hypothetical protein
LQIKTKIVSSHTADSKQVKQEINRTVILPPLVFPGKGYKTFNRGNLPPFLGTIVTLAYGALLP